MSKIVVGDYTNTTDAINKINTLITEGYAKDSISVIASRSAAPSLRSTGVTVERDFDYVEGVSDESLWERIKNFFGTENAKIYDENIEAYSDSIRNGDVLVLLDDTYPTSAVVEDTLYDTTDGPVLEEDVYSLTDDADKDDETLRLREERMDVDKKTIKAGDAVIHKRVVEETRTIDVPVMHEEVVIERRAVADEATDITDFDDETISIPVMEEQVVVSKHPVVTEEVLVHKRDVQNTEKVSATLRKEKLDVEQLGNTIVLDDGEKK
ncbi:YsnF/AvaK domain-containing protein [Eubacteriales bacterium OttesenSCG-928-A19]|nr:YsnF/AvaK domain-containing protein [Eubacteriales bacterium OttesenSCG-928-A19]